MYVPPLRYKRETLAAHRRIILSKLTQTQAIQHTVDVVYYAPAARTTLNLAVLIVFLSEMDLD